MESDQNVRNNATEVQSIDRAEKTARAVYRLDPHRSDWSFRITHDQMAKSTVQKFAFPVLFVMLSPSVKSEVKLIEWNPNLTTVSLSYAVSAEPAIVLIN